MPPQLPGGDPLGFGVRHRQNHRLESFQPQPVPETGVFGICVHYPPPFVDMLLDLAQVRVNA